MESARKVAVQSGWVNGSSFPTQTVGADRIRPQHKAPLRGACAGSPGWRPLQGVCVQPGTCENPGLRADSIRPYNCGGRAAAGSICSSTPTRAYRLKVCTTWLPPGGSCQTALRNRLTDEGRRTVGQEMQLDERYMFQIVPFNREIQNF